MKSVIEGLIKQAIAMFLTESMIENAKNMLIKELENLALSTSNEIDDIIVSKIKDALK